MAEGKAGEDRYTIPPDNSGLYNDAYADYDKQRREAQAAYENMAREARINKAMLERAGKLSDSAAGINKKAGSRTIEQRSENSFRNTLGKAQRQYDKYMKNVDHALSNLKIQEDADIKSSAARKESDANANRLSKRRSDAEFGLQRKQLDLYKSDSDFNKAYQLYLRRLIGKDKFKDMTGITVKSLPRPNVVLPPVIQDDSPNASKAAKNSNYKQVVYTDAKNVQRCIYVRNDVYKAADSNGVSFFNNGSPKDLLTLAEEICGAGSNPGVIKAGTERTSSMNSKDYAMLPGTNSGNCSEYYFVSNELINAIRDKRDKEVRLYNDNGKLKTEKQLREELGFSNDWWLNMMDYMAANKDNIIDMFGEDNYGLLGSYAAYSMGYMQ